MTEEEATITKWLKTEGQSIAEYEALVEVNTDKVDTEIPAPVSGTLLKILAPDEGSVVKVGTVIAWIGQPGESIPEQDSVPQSEVQAEVSEGEASPMVATTPKADSVAPLPESGKRDLAKNRSSY